MRFGDIPIKAREIREYIKKGYVVEFYYRDHYMQIGDDLMPQEVHTHEETRYIALMDNENVGTCSGEGEAVAGFSKDFRKQIEDARGVYINLYKELPEDIKKFFNKEILRGDENERYNKRRAATI